MNKKVELSKVLYIHLHFLNLAVKAKQLLKQKLKLKNLKHTQHL